ncbi:MAG: 3-oxoacyl-ACP reductase FabG [Nannocystaceae bacterium]|nr:3-oxoacyl-ACP reductase FabG [Nannocystaceae bacterium]
MTSEKTTALVTGGSRGIGAAVARRLATAGHRILVNFRANDDAAASVVEDIVKAGGEAESLQFDVRDAEGVEHALGRVIERGDAIGIVVNNAGVLADGPFPSLEKTQWDSVVRTTLDGFYNVTRPLVMPMVRRRWGRIINIASVSGLIGVRGQTNYSAAKGGLIAATRSLAQELAKRRITVNAVAPGLIETEMIEHVDQDRVLERIPARRLGRVEEVAALVGFLAGDEAAYITGQVVGINGGLA